MGDQLANNPEALRLFFTEDIYLVQPGAEESLPSSIQQTNAVPVSSTPSFNYLGKNERNILILVYDEVNAVTTDAGREVFRNIVKAKNLSVNDYAILNYAAYRESSFAELVDFFNAKAILTFGVKALQLGIQDYPQHTVVNHAGVQLMFSADLHELSMDRNIKLALWTVLKEMEL